MKSAYNNLIIMLKKKFSDNIAIYLREITMLSIILIFFQRESKYFHITYKIIEKKLAFLYC